MKNRLIISVVVVALALGALIFSAASSAAKEVVTVSDLSSGIARKNILLGARVISETPQYKTEPDFELRFDIVDISSPDKQVPVVYHGLMPDSFQAGRDVILEGSFDGKEFTAKTLMTQCPSKYEPPMPE